MEHHNIDVHPFPSDKSARFINEPWLIDESIWDSWPVIKEIDDESDNIRVYVPLDLNRKAILRRLDWIIYRFGGASEYNELNYSQDVAGLIAQIEIYDQIWRSRHYSEGQKHSKEAIELVKEFVTKLKEIPDECAEQFPFMEIEELEEEYL